MVDIRADSQALSSSRDMAGMSIMSNFAESWLLLGGASAFGVFLGIIIGVLPGLGPLFGTILLLPVVLHVTAEIGLSILVGIFVGGSFGGAITAILLRIPGTPIAAATLLDGYPMAQAGRERQAIGFAISASTLGGFLGGAFLLFASPLLAKAAMEFGPPEYFSLAAAGIVCIALVSQGTLVRGLIVGCLGLLIAAIGMDPFTVYLRFTFDQPQLMGGIGIVPLVLGLFALSEMLKQCSALGRPSAIAMSRVVYPPWRSLSETLRRWPTLLRASSIGTLVGALPGAGGVVAGFIAYAAEKALSSSPERFGRGAEEGVIASEAANNACAGGALIPTLALGLPGDAVAAIFMTALLMIGFIPGPELFMRSPEVVQTVFASYMVSNAALLVLAFALLPLFIRLAKTPAVYLIPGVLVLMVVGSFGVNFSASDLWFIPVFGVLGLLLDKCGYPLAPLTIAPILGPILEENFRRSLIMSGGDYSIFMKRPLAAAILIACVIAMILTVFPLRRWGRAILPGARRQD